MRESFVAYETDWSFKIKGYLRHKFDCKDKSKENLSRLIQDMESSLRKIDAESIKNDNKYKQCNEGKILDITISQTVTEEQKKILEQIQKRCESELLIDLCNDTTIRIKNNWGVYMIFRYDTQNDDIIISGNQIDIDNFISGKNLYF